MAPEQQEAIEWALMQDSKYLLINAPTGSGKTIIQTGYGCLSATTWLYVVHTKALQSQVVGFFQDSLPLVRGHNNFDCWNEDFDYEIADGYCDNDGCDYNVEVKRGLAANYAVTNYAMAERLVPLRLRPLLLLDEAHRLERIMADMQTVRLPRAYFARRRRSVPNSGYKDWATKILNKYTGRGSLHPRIRSALHIILKDYNEEGWIVKHEPDFVELKPVWGTPFVSRFLGGARSLLTSATLMGDDYVTTRLGFKEGESAYLDVPCTFPVKNRPVNFDPVVDMNKEAMRGNHPARKAMQTAIDKKIDEYVAKNHPTGLIHAVSRTYQAFILTESRWSAIMVKDKDEHEERVKAGKASVLVSVNAIEGWDGIDELCRFVLFPKIPYPNLGDPQIKRRLHDDNRSFDYDALVSVVQGAGRGVRHDKDYCDTWIFDGTFGRLYDRRKDWLTKSFREALRK